MVEEVDALLTSDMVTSAADDQVMLVVEVEGTELS